MKLRLKGTAVFLILVTLSARAQERHAFSAKHAVEYAKKNNTQVKNALLDIKIQEQVNKEVTAAALPNVSARSKRRKWQLHCNANRSWLCTGAVWYKVLQFSWG